MSTANGTQVGGDHYKDVPAGQEQHWDMMWRLFREAWFVGNVSKYLFRYRRKNGVEDLKKARHYLDKLIELEEADDARRQGLKVTQPAQVKKWDGTWDQVTTPPADRSGN